jgi:HSP20 family protein
MLVQRHREYDLLDSIKDMQRLQTQLNRLFSSDARSGSTEFPPLNIWTSESGAVVRAEIPGVEPEQVDVSMVSDTLTIKGSLSVELPKSGQTCHRQERGCGQFLRSIQLPFGIDADKAQAKFADGILEIRLPRAEADRPRKISVVSH